MEIKEDAYSNRASLTARKRCFGYPANPLLFIVVAAALIGAQARSVLLFAALAAFQLAVLGVVCRDDPNGIAVWLCAIRRRLLKRITHLSPDMVAERPFIFTE